MQGKEDFKLAIKSITILLSLNVLRSNNLNL